MRTRIEGMVWCAAVSLAVACGGSSPPAADAGFGAIRHVSDEAGNGATPMYLITPDGRRVLAWISAAGGGSDGRLHLVVSPAGPGEALRADIADSLGPIEPHGESPPQLAADAAGGLYVQYTVGKEVPGERFPKSALRLIRSTDGGASWSAPATVNEGTAFGAHNFHALLAGPGGRLFSTWLGSSPSGGPSLVWLRRSMDGGRTWIPTQVLHREPTCPCCRTALARAADGILYAAWRRIFPGDVRDIVVARSTDGGNTWGAPVRPREDGWVYPGCPHAGPSLRVDEGGAVHIAWWTGKAKEAGVYYAKSTDGGRSFTSQPIAVGERSAPVHVQLALAPAGPIVVWDDGFAAIPAVLLRSSTDGGATFGAVIRASPEGEAGTFPVVAVTHDSVLVAWGGRTSAAHHAEMAAHQARDPNAPMGLPRVGEQMIFERAASVRAVTGVR